ncbi:hypothetical protein CAEBREN_22739 [Caenorhabditis brenneri]|uniref:AAA+ ATPase domain-containing protein n=1 Tax=Caenorhabditis brenneri TaxID=135651 RepID=G0PJI9_CAEBE|nr:hypothetical protein CAEBREN_22739 [Caenorhabditis brenneri]
MDDDYNVLSTGFAEDDGALQYPDDDGVPLAVVSNVDTENQRHEDVRNALEEVGYARRKRRLDDVEQVYDKFGRRSHPMDWHMRMDPVSADVHEKSKINSAKRRALESLEQKINEVATEANTLSGDHLGAECVDEETIHSLCDQELARRYKRRKEIMKNPPSDGSPWIGLSDVVNGQRFYIRTFRDDSKSKPLVETISRQSTQFNVGYRAFQSICKEAEDIRVLKEETRVKRQEEEFSRMLDDDSSAFDTSTSKHVESALWVNKYEAKNFSDLLSDSTVNRNILTWLKMWDECVFRKKIDDLLGSLGDREREVLQMDNGKIRRPALKMLLISGPAGLGKSTLARIVARQAGYSTIDVNASDARTVADLNKVLEGAVKTSRTLDADQRPACLILDEIDGTPIDTIRHLIRCLQANGKKAVRRPIIGICNNLFTPALRDLRSVAWCVQLGATKQDALAKRLEEICDHECLRCDLSTLRKLCDLCGNDMRHSINTLQWVAIAARKSNKTIGMKLIHEVIQKEKGGATSIFDDWSAVLELTKHADVKGGIKAVRERVLAIEKISAEHGGEDRFVSGLHANYLVSLPIGVIRRASTWFSFYDDIQKTIHTYQNWSVQKYMFSVFVSLHLNIATHARVPIQYPHLEQTMFQKMKESEETINAVRSCGHSGRGAPKKELLLDVLPFIVGIVQPPIKPMNESLYDQRELATFNQTVSIMCDYGLTYTATMVKDQVNWLFTPSIDITVMRVRLADSTSHQSLSEKISTNTDKIKDIIDSENRKKKRLSAGEMKRIQNGKLSDILFTHQDGDSSAVKKKVTMQQLNKIIFGDS